MPIALTSQGRDIFESVEVRDPSGQRRAVLGPLPASTTIAEVRARATSQLLSSQQTDWNVRYERTGRLLNDQQCLADLTADRSTRLDFSLQVDAALG